MRTMFLRICSLDRENRLHPVGEATMILGRAPQCDIVIDDPCISRRHLELERLSEKELHLRDLDSRNPPRIDGQIRREAVLHAGSTFDLGSTRITVTSGGERGELSTRLDFGRDPSREAVTTELSLEQEPRTEVIDIEPALTSEERFRRLAAIGERIASAKSPGELIEIALDGLMGALPASRGFIGLGSPLDGEYAEMAVRDPANPDGTRIEMSRTILDRIYENRSALLVVDAPRLGGLPHDSITEIGILSFAAAPVIVREQYRGVIYLDSTRTRGALQNADLEILKVVARLVALGVENLSAREQLRRENETFRALFERRQGIIGSSDAMQKTLALVQRAAATESPVLILGETGTGKELFAGAIHDQSRRREGPFVAINCAIASPEMIDSALFGHDVGAFTGAVRDHQGVFEQAHKGTLFLDEIGDMPLSTQVKILRVVQDGKVVRVGGEKSISVDVRIISATHRDLEARQATGQFREDLRYRLDVLRFQLPPLRDRGDDVIEIAEALLPKGVEFNDAARRALRNHSWPGNVRELRNAVEQALCSAPSSKIRLCDLPATVAIGGRRPQLVASLPTLAQIERRHTERVLKETGDNKKRTAEILGISRETLYQKLRAWKEQDRRRGG